MKTSQANRRHIAALVAALTFSSLTAGAQNIYRYNASLGTFPEAQGFTFVQTPGFVAPTVSAGVLHQYATNEIGSQYWAAANASFYFSNGIYVLEAAVRIISAKDNGPVPPDSFGYQLEVIDAAKRIVSMSIATNAVIIYGGVRVPFATTDATHVYRVEIADGRAALFIDGIQYDSVPIGAANNSYPPNRAYFGDGGSVGGAEAELREFRFTRQPVATRLTIEVSQVRLCWNSESNKVYDVQYRSDLTTNAWANLYTNVVAMDFTTCVFDAVPSGQPQRFYRVEETRELIR